MSNEVWVKWEDGEGGYASDTVDHLEDYAQIKDLRKTLFEQQKLNVAPAMVKVSVTKDGEPLNAGHDLAEYFVTPRGSAGLDGPGKSKK
jgi:hypothetical protein